VSESQRGCHGYYRCCLPFEVRSVADERVERGIRLLWLLGVPVRYALRKQKQLSNERMVQLKRIKKYSRLACSENKENAVEVTVK
jgi:hypothetical protein